MQALKSDNLSLAQHSTDPAVNGDGSGLSQGLSNLNLYSTGVYHDRLNSTVHSLTPSRTPNAAQQAQDIQSPATAYDMNFTPLLPSQLLMGSPFQPGSPATFTTPHFQSFTSFTTQPSMNAQVQPADVNNSMPAQQSLASQMSQMFPQPSAPAPFPQSQYYGGGPSNVGGFVPYGNNFTSMAPVSYSIPVGTSRVVYLGNIPPETSAEEILNHIRSGQIESVRFLMDRNCVFISFLDGNSAFNFHSDALLKKLSIRGQEIKVGWGKPAAVPALVATAVQQSGASRNVYLGNLPPEITEEEIRDDLGRFGPVDTLKMVREKGIAFVHFLSIASAIKAVNQLPQEEKWQAPRRVFYGKDRCAYVSKTQQQNAAQFLGIPPTYAHMFNSADRDALSSVLAQQSVAAAAVATAAGGANNVGNRTVYLGNIHPETTTEEICNVVRGGLLHHIRYIPDKHICFVTFIDPTSAASFFSMSNNQGLMIHSRRLKIGWGKHSGPLPPAIALAVSAGASRNVYIGNIDETWSEERLKQDFAEYGETELVNMLREKSCAFVNFTNIANAIKAIEAVKGREEYSRCKVNFGKDRCGNPPRQMQPNQQDNSQQNGSGAYDGLTSPTTNGNFPLGRNNQLLTNFSSFVPGNPRYPFVGGQAPPTQPNFNGGGNTGFTMYTSQAPNGNGPRPYYPTQQQQNQPPANGVAAHNGLFYTGVSPYSQGGNLAVPQQNGQQVVHGTSNSFNAPSNGAYNTVGGLLPPSNVGAAARAQHSRAISLPSYSQSPFTQQQQSQHAQQSIKGTMFNGTGTGLGLGTGSGLNGFGLAIHGDGGYLSRWAEEEHVV